MKTLHRISVSSVFCFALLLSSCSEKNNESIVGKWRVEKDGTIVEYHPDGTFSFTGNNVTVAGTYKFSDSSHLTQEIPMHLQPKDVTMTVVSTLQFSGDSLDMDSTIKVPDQPDQKDHNHLTRVK
ncbi:MAG TPA: hypothetical protein VH255_07160 [Verrucomicrobiae bacterium]|jgi:uncharacterized protein (DUF2147 family)|nr:hypothetical protein [Verrucomicrobiae bacterium]